MNRAPADYPSGSAGDVVTIDGYDGYAAANVNGMNVLLYEDGVFRMYFGDFRDFGKVYRATSRDGRRYALDGVALDGVALDGVALAQRAAVNDVKKLRVGDGNSRISFESTLPPTTTDVRSIAGASSVTVTVSAIAPTSSRRSSVTLGYLAR